MQSLSPTPATGVTLNLHLTARCNYRCRFCWATFKDVRGTLAENEWLQLLKIVARERRLFDAFEVDKITFAGGEPTLLPWLPNLIRAAHDHGFTTCVVTNASRIDAAWLDSVGPYLDWLTLSLDSADEMTNKAIGRGTGTHVERVIQVARLTHALCAPRLRVNSVVTSANHVEDLGPALREIRPHRWKVLQGTRIEGQNDGADDLLCVSDDEFQSFCARHAAFEPVVEDASSILGSYLMVDPSGRAFNNEGSVHTYGGEILCVGLKRSIQDIGWKSARFVARGGAWPWRDQAAGS